MDCRPGCGACCIAPSITSPIPGMAGGKPAGVACLHLRPDMSCAIFGRADRPAFCAGLKPAPDMCGQTRDQAIAWLDRLEAATRPAPRRGDG